MLRFTEIKESPFDLIYNLAKAKNKDELNNLVNAGWCVGAFKNNENNVMLLAQEGDFESVSFLIEHFSANMNHALYGAARGCHIRFIKNAIDTGWPSLNYMAKGMAVCGNIETIEELIDRGASLHDTVEGAAMGGHERLVFDLLNRGASIDFAGRGAASVGNEVFANDLLTRGAKLSFVAEGAARGGFITYSKKLLDRAQIRSDSRWLQVFKSLQRGAAHSGNVGYTKDLLHQIRIINHSLYGAASGGHFGIFSGLFNFVPEGHKEHILAEALKYAANEGHVILTINLYVESHQSSLVVNSAIYGAAAGGNLKLANDLLSYYATDTTFAAQGAASGYQVEVLNRLTKKWDVNLDLVVDEMEKKGYFASKDILRFICFVDNIQLRRLLCNSIPIYLPVFNSSQLFSMATKKNELMRKYNLTFYQSQAYLNLMSQSGYSWMLLQGNKYFCASGFPFELFLKIISHFVGELDRAMNNIDSENIYYAAHQRLRDRVITGGTTGFFSLFKSKANLEQIEASAEARYKQRSKYV